MKNSAALLLCLVTAMVSYAQSDKSILKIRARYADCPEDSLYLRVRQDQFYFTSQILFENSRLLGKKKNDYFEWTIKVDSSKNGFIKLYIKNPDTSKLGTLSNYPENSISYPILFSPGDSLDIVISSPQKAQSDRYEKLVNYSFSGRGYYKNVMFAALRKHALEIQIDSPTLTIETDTISVREVSLIRQLNFINNSVTGIKDEVTLDIFKTLYTNLYWKVVNDNLRGFQLDFMYAAEKSINLNQTLYEKFINTAESNFKYEYADSCEMEYFSYHYNRITSNLTNLDDQQRKTKAKIAFRNIIDAKNIVSKEDLLIRFFQLNKKDIEGFDSMYRVANSIVQNKEKREQLLKYEDRKDNLYTYKWELQDNSSRLPFKFPSLKNKIVFIDFWFTGCHACTEYYTEHLKTAEAYFKEDKNVAFVSINVDLYQERWKKSIESKKYTNSEVINLHTNGLGFRHPMLQYLQIPAYPSVMLFDKKGNLIFVDKKLSSSELIKEIKQLM